MDPELQNFLTTLASVVVGGILSGIGGYAAAIRSAKAQIAAASQSSFIPARLASFQEFESALEVWSNDQTENSCAAVYRASNAVRLVASEETIVCLGVVQEYVRGFETTGKLPPFSDFAQAHNALLDAMRNDLLTYPVLKPVKQEQTRPKIVHKQTT